MDYLYNIFRLLLNLTDTTFVRFLHGKIDWSSKMICIVGPRGTGKTTMILQHIKMHNSLENTLFVNADDVYFSEHRLYDTALEFYNHGGKHFYIDEIHKYSDWSRELKMMYDYFPDMQVVFTGSSVLDIYKGNADLSRRVISYYLPGLSFREFLEMGKGIKVPTYSFDEIINNKVSLPVINERPQVLFEEYLEKGYYPFFKDPNYMQLLNNIINVSIENDIPSFAGMNVSTARKIKQLLYVVAQNAPFKPNYTSIGNMIGANRNMVADFICYLEKAGILMQLRGSTGGIRLVGKVEKVYMNNTNLMEALSEGKPEIGNVRETFFMSQMTVNNDVFSHEKADFQIGEYVFEVGGRSKQQKQIQGLDNAFIVKDGIDYGYQNVIPLWHFGFNY